METELISGTIGIVFGILGTFAKTRKYRRILEAVIRGVNAATANANQGRKRSIKEHIRRASLEDHLQDALHREVRRVEAKGKKIDCFS